MLNIQIDNPELEESIRQTYGGDVRAIANAFAAFVREQRIRQDVGISISQLEAGAGMNRSPSILRPPPLHVPRRRGDEPHVAFPDIDARKCSPQARG